MFAQHGPLDLRHLDTRPQHRQAVVKAGGNSWFFLTTDYAFGHDLERMPRHSQGEGGKVLGGVRHPFDTSDFSSFILRRARPGQRSSDSPTPAVTPPTPSSRGRNSASSRARKKSPDDLLSHQRPRTRARNHARPDLTEPVLLGLQRRDARVRPAVRREARGRDADHVQAGMYSAVTHYLKASSRPRKRTRTATRWSPR